MATQFYVYEVVPPPNIGVVMVSGPHADRAVAETVAAQPGAARKVIEAGSAREAGWNAMVAFGVRV